MSASVPKLTMSASRDIPFDKLVLSQANVRRVKCGVSIPELAEDIVRRTLLQSLNVRPLLDAEGKETGKFEVPAGGRRFRPCACKSCGSWGARRSDSRGYVDFTAAARFEPDRSYSL